MKMQHSNMYVRATSDGERVVQSWANDWEWNQVWRLLGKDDEISTKDTSTTALGQITNVYGTSIHQINDNLFVEMGSEFKKGASIRILDLQGREILRQQALHSASINIKALSPGLYHAVVSDGVRTDVKRFKK